MEDSDHSLNDFELSRAPLLPQPETDKFPQQLDKEQIEDTPEMATDISPRPEQLDVHRRPEDVAGAVGHEVSLQNQDSVQSLGVAGTKAKPKRESCVMWSFMTQVVTLL